MIKYLACQEDNLVREVAGVKLQWPEGVPKPKANLNHLINQIKPVLGWMKWNGVTQRAFADHAVVKVGRSPRIAENA